MPQTAQQDHEAVSPRNLLTANLLRFYLFELPTRGLAQISGYLTNEKHTTTYHSSTALT